MGRRKDGCNLGKFCLLAPHTGPGLWLNCRTRDLKNQLKNSWSELLWAERGQEKKQKGWANLCSEARRKLPQCSHGRLGVWCLSPTQGFPKPEQQRREESPLSIRQWESVESQSTWETQTRQKVIAWLYHQPGKFALMRVCRRGHAAGLQRGRGVWAVHPQWIRGSNYPLKECWQRAGLGPDRVPWVRGAIFPTSSKEEYLFPRLWGGSGLDLCPCIWAWQHEGLRHLDWWQKPRPVRAGLAER